MVEWGWWGNFGIIIRKMFVSGIVWDFVVLAPGAAKGGGQHVSFIARLVQMLVKHRQLVRAMWRKVWPRAVLL